MRRSTRTTPLRAALAAVSLAAPAAAAQDLGGATEALAVSPQGRLVDVDGPAVHTSPLGGLRVEAETLEGDGVQFASRLRLATSDGRSSAVPRVVAAAVLATDVERVVVLEDHCSNVAPRQLLVLDLDGRVVHGRRVAGVASPALSADGAQLVYRTPAGVTLLDLVDFAETTHPAYDLFAAAGGGRLVGVHAGSPDVVEVRDGTTLEARIVPRERPRRVAFAPDGASVLVLGERALVRHALPGGAPTTLYVAPEGAELRDLAVEPGAVLVGERRRRDGVSLGRLVRVGADGRARTVTTSASTSPSVPDAPHELFGLIPWPLAPNAQQPIGNSYAEFQQYGGSPYLHPGIDVLGADLQPVFAVHGGEVKAELTTSGQYHWRVAIANEPGAAASEGYLYAHLVESSIAVDVGDVVVEGQYLGDLVPWPVASFTHVHFARIEDAGVVWQGDWLTTDNPHLELPHRTESSAPVFENARGSDLFAFCRDETSLYLDPDGLSGAVDVIVHVGDTIDSGWVCCVQTLRYSIWPVGNPDAKVVDGKLAVEFDFPSDRYAGGPRDPFLVDLLFKQDSTCDTQGDYGDREFFHVITNSDGDDVLDADDSDEAWDTTLVLDGDYVIEVVAWDAAGNSATASMVVTVDN